MPFDGRDRENILKHLFMQPSPPLDDENRKGLIVGTVVTERYLYRFSPTKSAVQTPYTIEERQHFRVLEDKSLECLGEKSVIFRGAGNQDGTGNPLDHGSFSKDYTKIGPALYAVEGMHNSSTDKIRSSKEPGNKTNLVMALYCMEHPEVFKGRGLEVGSGVGIGGILSIIGAGVSSDPSSVPSYPNNKEDDEAPAPQALDKILMTDQQEDILERCIENLDAAKFPESKVKLGLLEWGKPVQDDIRDQCQFIIGCDCSEDFVPLARTIAFALKCSPFDGQGGTDMTRANFLHVEPRYREHGDDLRRELKRGYKMNTMMMKEIELECIHLEPLFSDSLEDANAIMAEDMQTRAGGFVKHQRIDTSGYSALVGYHHKDYCGFNGKKFFPAELERQNVSPKEQEVDDLTNNGADAKLPSSDGMNIATSPEEIIQDKSGKKELTEKETIVEEPVKNKDKPAQAEIKMDLEVLRSALAAEAESKIRDQLRTEETKGKTKLHAQELRNAREKNQVKDELNAESQRQKTIVAVAKAKAIADKAARFAAEAEVEAKAKHTHIFAVEFQEEDEIEENMSIQYEVQGQLAAEKEKGVARETKEKMRNEEAVTWTDDEKLTDEPKVKAEDNKSVESERYEMSGLGQLMDADSDVQEVTKGGEDLVISYEDRITREISKEDSVRTLYTEWCKLYNKEENESRFHIFFANLISMEAYSKKARRPLKLNQWYDCTEEEYVARRSERLILSTTQERDDDLIKVSLDREMITAHDDFEGKSEDGVLDGPKKRESTETKEVLVRSVYAEWCKLYRKKEDESRFPIFLSNYLAMEAFSKESGKPLQLNQWYDCTEEEYIARSTGQVKCAMEGEETAAEMKDYERGNMNETVAKAEKNSANSIFKSLQKEQESMSKDIEKASLGQVLEEREAEAVRLKQERIEKDAEAVRLELEAREAEAAKFRHEEQVLEEREAEAAKFRYEEQERIEREAEAARDRREEQERLEREAELERLRIHEQETLIQKWAAADEEQMRKRERTLQAKLEEQAIEEARLRLRLEAEAKMKEQIIKDKKLRLAMEVKIKKDTVEAKHVGQLGGGERVGKEMVKKTYTADDSKVKNDNNVKTVLNVVKEEIKDILNAEAGTHRSKVIGGGNQSPDGEQGEDHAKTKFEVEAGSDTGPESTDDPELKAVEILKKHGRKANSNGDVEERSTLKQPTMIQSKLNDITNSTHDSQKEKVIEIADTVSGAFSNLIGAGIRTFLKPKAKENKLRIKQARSIAEIDSSLHAEVTDALRAAEAALASPDVKIIKSAFKTEAKVKDISKQKTRSELPTKEEKTSYIVSQVHGSKSEKGSFGQNTEKVGAKMKGVDHLSESSPPSRYYFGYKGSSSEGDLASLDETGAEVKSGLETGTHVQHQNKANAVAGVEARIGGKAEASTKAEVKFRLAEEMTMNARSRKLDVESLRNAAKSARLQKLELDRLATEFEATRLKEEEEKRIAAEAEAEARERLASEIEAKANEAFAKKVSAELEAARLKEEEEEEKRIAAEAEAEAARLQKLEQQRIAAELEAARLKEEEEKRIAAEAEAEARERLASEIEAKANEAFAKKVSAELEAARLKEEEQKRIAAEAALKMVDEVEEKKKVAHSKEDSRSLGANANKHSSKVKNYDTDVEVKTLSMSIEEERHLAEVEKADQFAAELEAKAAAAAEAAAAAKAKVVVTPMLSLEKERLMQKKKMEASVHATKAKVAMMKAEEARSVAEALKLKKIGEKGGDLNPGDITASIAEAKRLEIIGAKGGDLNPDDIAAIDTKHRARSAALEMNQRSLLARRFQLDADEKVREARVRSIYLEWCGVYGKDVDEARFPIFRSNFIIMEAYADKHGKSMQLNQWYDRTEQEYEALRNVKAQADFADDKVRESIEREGSANKEEKAQPSEAIDHKEDSRLVATRLKEAELRAAEARSELIRVTNYASGLDAEAFDQDDNFTANESETAKKSKKEIDRKPIEAREKSERVVYPYEEEINTDSIQEFKKWTSQSYLNSLTPERPSADGELSAPLQTSDLLQPAKILEKHENPKKPIDLLYTSVTSSSSTSGQPRYSAYSGCPPRFRYNSQRVSSSTSNSNRIEFLRQKNPGAEISMDDEMNLRALEKLMEAKVELSVERAAERYCETRAEEVIEVVIEEAIRQYHEFD